MNEVKIMDIENISIDKIDKRKLKKTKFEMERIIGKYLYDEKYLPYDLYIKTDASILKDIEEYNRQL